MDTNLDERLRLMNNLYVATRAFNKALEEVDRQEREFKQALREVEQFERNILLMEPQSAGIAQQREIKRLRQQRDELFEALTPFAEWRLPSMENMKNEAVQNELHRMHQRARAAVAKVFDLGAMKNE